MPGSPSVPTFNLWNEQWIELECSEGGTERRSIQQALLQAHEFMSIYEPSPLVVVDIHRLLVAIVQAALNPQKNADLKRLWQTGRLPATVIQDFGAQYVERFDLFSTSAPFLQSGDLPLQAGKGDRIKTVAYLIAEIPAGTEITHYRHGAEDAQVFCPACAAAGLVTIPPFATSGGAGIKPSINGVPPIYVLPGGRSLFESLAASLLRPDYQPNMLVREQDEPWWLRRPDVKRGQEVREVGYLQSLTFPARRVRLHPEPFGAGCTRCGRVSQWGVRSMVFEMGECRPKEAEFWFDPFAAYKLPESQGKDKPTPIRPTLGRATWREFAGLFLLEQSDTADPKKKKIQTKRPAVLNQIAELEIGADLPAYPFRCIGMRTDFKAKVFEWIDAGFDVPPALLRDERTGLLVRESMDFATGCAGVITGAFREVFGGKSRKQERRRTLKTRMRDEYWAALAEPFRHFVLAVAMPDHQVLERRHWAEAVVEQAQTAFSRAAAATGDDAASLRKRSQGERLCQIRLARKRKEYLPDE